MDDHNQESISSKSDHLLQGWSKCEKLALVDSLKLYGSNCIEQIALNTGKSENDVRAAIKYYRNKSSQILKVGSYKKKKERKRVSVESRVPLGAWAKFLTDSINFKELQTETAAALHIIADFEDFPGSPSALPQEHIDFKKIYHMLGNALEGKTLPKDKMMAAVLEKCLLEAALTSKAFIRKSTFKTVMNDLKLSEPDSSLLPRPTPKSELASIRYLAHQRSYNPLNIPENVLKQSIFTKDDGVPD